MLHVCTFTVCVTLILVTHYVLDVCVALIYGYGYVLRFTLLPRLFTTPVAVGCGCSHTAVYFTVAVYLRSTVTFDCRIHHTRSVTHVYVVTYLLPHTLLPLRLRSGLLILPTRFYSSLPFTILDYRLHLRLRLHLHTVHVYLHIVTCTFTCRVYGCYTHSLVAFCRCVTLRVRYTTRCTRIRARFCYRALPDYVYPCLPDAVPTRSTVLRLRCAGYTRSVTRLRFPLHGWLPTLPGLRSHTPLPPVTFTTRFTG